MDKLIISCYNNSKILAHQLKGNESKYSVVYNNNYYYSDTCYNPAFILKHPTLQILYMCYESIYDGHIGTFKINKNNLEEMNVVSSEGKSSCYLMFDYKCKNIININYWDSTISIHPIDNNGVLLDATYIHKSKESNKLNGINDHLKNRQSEPHYHCIEKKIINNKEIFFVSDLGFSVIYFFEYNFNSQNKLQLIGKKKLNRNDGPRYIKIIDNLLLVINELSSSITTFNITNDFNNLLVYNQNITTILEEINYNTCGNLIIHPNKKFLYASNRGDDSIACYQIKNKKLILRRLYDSGGKTPRHFTINNLGDYLYCANQDSNNISIFNIDLANGNLKLKEKIVYDSPNFIFVND